MFIRYTHILLLLTFTYLHVLSSYIIRGSRFRRIVINPKSQLGRIILIPWI